MSVLKQFTPRDFQSGDMLVREVPPLSWLILEVCFEFGHTHFVAIDINNREKGPFEMRVLSSWKYPLQYKLLKKDEQDESVQSTKLQ